MRGVDPLVKEWNQAIEVSSSCDGLGLDCLPQAHRSERLVPSCCSSVKVVEPLLEGNMSLGTDSEGNSYFYSSLSSMLPG